MKFNKIIDKYIDLIFEQDESKNEIDECKLKEQTENIKGDDVGKHNHVPDSKFLEKELKRGIEVEKEHTNNTEIAKRIAKDHLSECKIYYTLLDQMENKCKRIIS